MTFQHAHRPSPSGEGRLLLLLHGTGGDEHDLIPLAGMLDPDAAILSPRGKILENGAPRFFKRLKPGVLDLEDLRVQTLDLAEFVKQKSAGQRVTAVGFSNGANIAASMLFETPDALNDAILIRAMLPYAPATTPNVRGKRVLLLAGERDPYSERKVTEELASILRAGGAEVEVHYATAGHELTAEDVEVARAWLARGSARVLRQFLEEVWNKKRFDRFGEFVSKDVRFHPIRGDARDFAGYQAGVAAFMARVRDVHFEVVHAFGEGEWAACRIIITGTLASTGRPVSVAGQPQCRVRGGKIVELWQLFDELGLGESGNKQ